MKSHGKFLDELHYKMINIYQDCTGKTTEELDKILATETWFTAEEYLNQGFIDKII